MKQSTRFRICELSIRSSEGSITEDETRELEHLLTGYPEAIEFYADLLMSMNLFNQRFQTQLPEIRNRQRLTEICGSKADAVPSFNPELWQAMAEYEQIAPSIKVEACQVQETPDRQERPVYSSPSHKINKVSLVTAVASLAAMLMLIAFVHLNPRRHQDPVTVLDVFDAQWSSPISTEKGSLVPVGSEPIYLSKGIASFTTSEDVEMIVEAPSEFRFPDSSRVELRFGRIYVKVPQQGLGFAVMTPSSRVVDLGTEFGVDVSSDGSSSVQVYEGQTLLASLVAGGVQEKNILDEGESEGVDGTTGHLRKTAFNSSAFVRHVNSSSKVVWRGEDIDLADLVGGGNGFGSGTRGGFIDTLTGEWHARCSIETTTNPNMAIQTNSQANPVSGSPYIDCVFIPDGENGLVAISSKGHFFDQAPDTSGTGWGGVINVRKILDRPILLNGQVYGSTAKPAIFMHANAGVTFDLNAIRGLFDDKTVCAFTADYGMAEMYPPGREPFGDFWVLVDGQVRFVQKGVKPRQGGTIQVALTEKDRFLTLITTDGGDNDQTAGEYETRYSFNDWCVFGAPKLKVK